MLRATSTIDRRELVIALAVAAVALLVYGATLAPTVTSEDSGELITAAYRTGVAHPPGFPLWCMLGRLFCLFGGVASPAWSVNLMSAVFGALTAAGVYLISRSLPAGVLPAAGGALCLAFSRHFWSQAVIAEVYTLNTVLFCGTVLALLRWRRTVRNGWLYVAAFVFGLGLTNHYMLMLVVSPALLVFLLLVRPRVLAEPRTVAWAALLLAGPLVLYAYLPLAAAGDPPMNWGDPSSWERFLRHVSRHQYRSLELGRTVDLSTKKLFVGHALGLLWIQFTPWVLVPLTALGWFLRGDRKVRWLLLGVVLANMLGLIALLQFTFEAENRSRVEEYYLPAYVAVAVLIAAGLAWVGERAKRLGWRRAGIALALTAPLFPLLNHWRANDMSRYWLAHDYNAALLRSLPPHAVYFPSGDFAAFPSVYLQACEGMRPDVLLAETTGHLSEAARSYLAGIDPDVDPEDLVAAQRAMILDGTRPVFSSSKSAIRVPADYRFEPWGLAYRVRDTDAPSGPEPPDLFAEPPLRNLGEPTALDALGRSILAHYFLMHGEALALRGENTRAVQSLRRAASYASQSKEGLNNLGSTAAERGYDELAEELFRDAAALSPEYATPRRNLARLLETRDRLDEAVALYEELARLDPRNESLVRKIANLKVAASIPHELPRETRIERILAALRMDPANPALHNNLGNLYAESGQIDRALQAYRNAIRADPSYSLVYKNLGLLYRDVLGDPQRGESFLERFRAMQGAPPGDGPR